MDNDVLLIEIEEHLRIMQKDERALSALQAIHANTQITRESTLRMEENIKEIRHATDSWLRNLMLAVGLTYALITLIGQLL